MTERAARLENIAVRRGRRTILQVDELEIERGGFLGLLGPNGAGKTTLLRLLAALLLPDSGSVEILGRDVTSLPRWRLPAVRKRIAYVPQSMDFNTTVPLTAREVVAMGVAGTCGLLRRPGEPERELLNLWIERLGLASLQRQTFHSLSGGERQKALLAKAMVQRPEILLLDEPTADLDIDWKEQLVGIIEEIYEKNDLTVIIVSHETKYIPPSCTDVALMKDGRIVLKSDRAAALSKATFEKLYGKKLGLQLSRAGMF